MTIRFTTSTAGYAAGVPVTTFTAAQEAAYVAAGVAVYASSKLQDGNAAVPAVRRVLEQSGVPAIIVPNGTIATSGVVTLGTALPLIYPAAWCYFPAGAVVGGLVGWYYVAFSSTTVGQVYTNFIATLSGQIALPASALTAAVGSNGAYTQATTAVTMSAAVVPANTMGAGGAVHYNALFSYNNTAGAKTAGVSFGGSSVFTSANTTTVAVNVSKRVQNRATNQQVIQAAVESGTASATAPTLLAIDTTADVTCAFTGQIAVATDYLVLESSVIEVIPAP